MDFAKRGAFIEHCRNTHRMNIKMASSANKPAPVAPTPPKPEIVTPQVPVQAAVSGTGSTGYKCDYCPKSFANRSNKNRHMLLSCEVARPQMRQRGENGGGSGMMAQTQVLIFGKLHVVLHMISQEFLLYTFLRTGEHILLEFLDKFRFFLHEFFRKC